MMRTRGLLWFSIAVIAYSLILFVIPLPDNFGKVTGGHKILLRGCGLGLGHSSPARRRGGNSLDGSEENFSPTSISGGLV